MKLKGILFNDVFSSSGLFGFFGEEKTLFCNFFAKDITFVSKGVTAFPYEQKNDFSKTTIKNFYKSKNKVVRFGAGVILSREDESNPGLEFLLNEKKWQSRTIPFLISLKLVSGSFEGKNKEISFAVSLFEKHKKEFRADLGIVLCVDDLKYDDYEKYTSEVKQFLEILSKLKIPIVVQISLSFPPDSISNIIMDTNCAAVMIRPSLFWDDLPKDAQKVFFQMKSSGIRQENGGYIFGKCVLPFSIEWLRQAKKYCADKPIIIGGGVLGSKNISDLLRLGASGIIVDKGTFLRFWNIGSVIKNTKKFFIKK